MKHAAPLALPLLFSATQAVATSGLDCRSQAEDGPRLLLTIGHGVGSAIVAASLSEGTHDLRLTTSGDDAVLAVAQSWIDEQRVWLDVTDRDLMNYAVRLRVEFQPRVRGRPAVGTLEHRGRTHRVRCVEA